MDTTFVRKDFYVDPPKAGSTPEEWQAWLKKDKQEAANAKRAFTRAQKAADLPENFQGTSMRRVNGVWKQSTAIGIAGGENGEGGHLEPMVAENQEKDYILARMGGTARCVTHVRSHADRRKARKARRNARQGR